MENWIWNLILSFIVLAFVCIIGGLLLERMSINNAPEQYCKDTSGRYVFYECQTIMGGTPCSDLKTDYWCEYNNGTSINRTEIERGLVWT